MEKICSLLHDNQNVFPGSYLTIAFKMATFQFKTGSGGLNFIGSIDCVGMETFCSAKMIFSEITKTADSFRKAL